MASRLHDHINSFTLERGIEFDQAYTLTPTRTGSNSAGTFSLGGITPVYQSTVGPTGGSGSWQFASPRTGSGSTGPTNFRVASSANTTDLATFSDNDWSIGLWFRLNNKITSQYTAENEIDILSCGGFRIAYSSSNYGGGATGNRFMASTNGSSYVTWQATSHTAVDANRWYYLAARMVSGTLSLYLDGTLTRTISSVGAITPSDLRFGSGNTTGPSASADMTWNISNFHYGTSASLTEGAIQSIWGVGSTSQAWTTAINSESPSPFVWVKFDQELGNPTTVTNSGSKTFNDLNGTRNGPASGATISNDGKSNQGISFVGDNATTGRTYFNFSSTNQYIFELDDQLWSVEWWAKVANTFGGRSPTAWSIRGTGTEFLEARYPGAGMTYNGSCVVQVYGATTASVISTTNVLDGAWHHYVATYNRTANTFKLYIDGQLNATTTTVDIGGLRNYHLKIGTDYANAAANMFNGSLDEFIIWEQELTATDVLDHYNSTLPPAVNINYTNTTGATASATSPNANVSLPRNYNSDPLTASADIVMPAFSVSTPVTVNADVTTASADSVMPAIILDTNADAFGVGTASADSVTPTIQVQKENNYSADPATASALFTAATVTITKAVSYSASPATSSALLGGNVYAGPTVQDIHYDLTIRQIGNTTNTNGTGGFTLGSTWDSNTKLDMNSLAIKPVSGIPSNGSLIKVRIAGSPDITITNQDVNGDNEYNIYVFTANPSTTFDTMTGANLPAKELLYKTRANDNDAQRLDLTPAFKDNRGQTYGIYIEHVGTPPYSGTVWDRVSYSGSNLNTKALYILTSEFTNVNYNAPAATATGTQTDVSVYVERYINVSESPATASGLAVHPTIITERTVNVAAMETTASAQAVQPAFSGGATYTSDHLEAFAEGLAFVISTTRNVNIAVDPSTLSALLHMPQAQIGENNSVDHMNASATFPMPTLLFERNIQPDQLLATALMRDSSITTQQRGTIRAEVMTARAFMAENPIYFNYQKDKWLKRVYDFQNNQFGYPVIPFLKFFTMSSDILSNSLQTGNPAFIDEIALTTAVPQGMFMNDRAYTLRTSSWETRKLAFSSGNPGKLEVGYFDNQNRKAVRFNNIGFQFRSIIDTATGRPNPDTWSIEMMFKTSKQNQVIFGRGPVNISGNSNRTFNMGLYNGKFFATHTVSGPGLDDPAYRAFAWDPVYGVNGNSQYSSNVVGNKVIADGQWHHIVIQSIGRRLQVFVDGDLDFQRYNVSMIYPGTSIGYGGWSADADCDFYISALSMSPDAYLSDREIDLNNSYANGFAVYEATPATATLTMTQGHKARGNRPRALALYWWPNRRAASGAIERQEDLWDSQASGYANVEFDYRTFYRMDTYNPRSQKFFGWDIYTVDVTGTYYSEIVNYDSYSGGVRTYETLIGRGPGVTTETTSVRGFRDPITDNRRYIDLINDVDLDQVEAIFFLNYPNETREVDAYITEETVDFFFNVKEKDIYQDFLKGLRAAVDKGINLMVSNSQLALDLGIVDRVEIIDPLIDGVTIVNGGRNDGTKGPEIAISSEDWNKDNDRATAMVLGAGSKLSEKDGQWADTSFNNRLRIVNTIPGITDLMYFTFDDWAYFQPNGQYRYGAPPEFSSRMVYRPNGATVGTEFVMPDAANSWNPQSADFARRYLAVPFANVKAGKIVAAFGQNYYRKNQLVENPYKNYATHIALERGTVLNGKPLGGRIWVTITERPQSSTGTESEIELSTDYWIDLAYNLGLITQNERTVYKARPNNLDRRLASGDITQEQYNKATYWSKNGANQTTSVSSAQANLLQQAVAGIGKLFEQIFTTAQKQQAEEAGLGSFFNYSGTGITAMVQNFYTEPIIAVPTVTLNQAAFGWLANKEVVPGTQVRDVAGTASAIMIQPTVVGDKLVAQNAQAMLATADVKDPTNFIWTQKNNNYVSLPMLASALINPKLTLVRADAMTAAAVFKENIGALVTQVDEVILYINHVDPVLYLREDIVK